MSTEKKSKVYEIEVSSDVDYENLISSVYISGIFVASLWLDNSDNTIKIDIMKDYGEEIDKVRIELNTFLQALDDAKIELTQSIRTI